MGRKHGLNEDRTWDEWATCEIKVWGIWLQILSIGFRPSGVCISPVNHINRSLQLVPNSFYPCVHHASRTNKRTQQCAASSSASTSAATSLPQLPGGSWYRWPSNGVSHFGWVGYSSASAGHRWELHQELNDLGEVDGFRCLMVPWWMERKPGDESKSQQKACHLKILGSVSVIWNHTICVIWRVLVGCSWQMDGWQNIDAGCGITVDKIIWEELIIFFWTLSYSKNPLHFEESDQSCWFLACCQAGSLVFLGDIGHRPRSRSVQQRQYCQCWI